MNISVYFVMPTRHRFPLTHTHHTAQVPNIHAIPQKPVESGVGTQLAVCPVSHTKAGRSSKHARIKSQKELQANKRRRKIVDVSMHGYILAYTDIRNLCVSVKRVICMVVMALLYAGIA